MVTYCIQLLYKRTAEFLFTYRLPIPITITLHVSISAALIWKEAYNSLNRLWIDLASSTHERYCGGEYEQLSQSIHIPQLLCLSASHKYWNAFIECQLLDLSTIVILVTIVE